MTETPFSMSQIEGFSPLLPCPVTPAGYVLLRIDPWDQLIAPDPAGRQFLLLTHLRGHVQTLFGPSFQVHRLSANEFLLIMPEGAYACFTYQCHRLRLAMERIPVDPTLPMQVALSLCQRPPRHGWPYMLGRLRRLTLESPPGGGFRLGVA
jgi:hypothetical protein